MITQVASNYLTSLSLENTINRNIFMSFKIDLLNYEAREVVTVRKTQEASLK